MEFEIATKQNIIHKKDKKIEQVGITITELYIFMIFKEKSYLEPIKQIF